MPTNNKFISIALWTVATLIIMSIVCVVLIIRMNMIERNKLYNRLNRSSQLKIETSLIHKTKSGEELYVIITEVDSVKDIAGFWTVNSHGEIMQIIK
jgi:hypothetical protein